MLRLRYKVIRDPHPDAGNRYVEFSILTDEYATFGASRSSPFKFTTYPEDPAELRKLGEDIIRAADELRDSTSKPIPAESTETAA